MAAATTRSRRSIDTEDGNRLFSPPTGQVRPRCGANRHRSDRTIRSADAENVTAGDIPFRKAWLQAIVDRVEVGADVIRIIGDQAGLEAPIAGAGSSSTPGLRSSVRKSRASDKARLPPQRYQPFSVSAKHSKPDFAPTKSRLLRLCAIKHPTPGWLGPHGSKIGL